MKGRAKHRELSLRFDTISNLDSNEIHNTVHDKLDLFASNNNINDVCL